MNLQNFMIFGTYKLHKAVNDFMLTLVRQRALQIRVLSLRYSSFAYSLLLIFCTLKQSIIINCLCIAIL